MHLFIPPLLLLLLLIRKGENKTQSSHLSQPMVVLYFLQASILFSQPPQPIVSVRFTFLQASVLSSTENTKGTAFSKVFSGNINANLDIPNVTNYVIPIKKIAKAEHQIRQTLKQVFFANLYNFLACNLKTSEMRCRKNDKYEV